MPRQLPTWRELHPDDDPRVEAMLFARYRDASPTQKLAMAGGLRRQAIQLATSGLRLRHPGASGAEIRRRLADLLLGSDLARSAYGVPLWERESDPRTAPDGA